MKKTIYSLLLISIISCQERLKEKADFTIFAFEKPQTEMYIPNIYEKKLIDVYEKELADLNNSSKLVSSTITEFEKLTFLPLRKTNLC
ncbi:MAG: hypothetical protein ACI85I_000557 [Arenicella sp.]|jgi:hypothetical protein